MPEYDEYDEYDEFTPDTDSSVATEESPTKEEAPSRPTTRVVRGVQGGWGEARKTQAETNPFPSNLKPTADGVVVKFLGDGPYATFKQHWINEIKEGQRAFTCLDGIPDEDGNPQTCPLCEGGSRASARFQFNVALLEEGVDPILKCYDVGPTVFDQLASYHTDKRQGPLQRHYWVIKRTKNGNKWTTTLFLQKDDDLKDQGIEPPTEEQLKALKPWGPDTVRIPERTDLLEIAATYLGLE